MEDERLSRYADLIVTRGLNVQPGQEVNIVTEVYHRDLALLIADAAYKIGASYVNIDLIEPRLARSRVISSQADYLAYQPTHISAKYRELVERSAANVRIIGMEFPEILSDLDAKKVNAVRKGQYQAMSYYYKEGIEKSAVHWTVVAAATPKWGKRIFPQLTPEAAEKALWEQIFKICRVQNATFQSDWEQNNAMLQERAKKLTTIGIKTLHFQGPGTDLKVGLSELAVFKGGSEMGPRGVEFEPNIPTEECFTTPDCRLTEGVVAATRPFLVNGKLITGLKMRFSKGELVEFTADEGEGMFREYISSDPGGRRLGEVALVGVDSPIYESGLIFEEILFDENAACHIAVGSSYKFCLRGGADLSDEELAAVGANQSTVHTDMMISSDQVSVTASTYDGRTVPIISSGRWVQL